MKKVRKTQIFRFPRRVGRGVAIAKSGSKMTKNNRFSPFLQLDEAQAQIKYEGNIVYGAKTGVSSMKGLFAVDPKLMKDKLGIYRPQKDSPAKGEAKGSYPKITADMDGQQRQGQIDIGADQISSQPVKHWPLSIKDVGPTWKR